MGVFSAGVYVSYGCLRPQMGAAALLVFCAVHCIIGEYWSECVSVSKRPSHLVGSCCMHMLKYTCVCVQCSATANLQTFNANT